MKKLFLSMSIAAFGMLAMANPKEGSEKINTSSASESLKTIYGYVGPVKWRQAKENLLRADFTVDGQLHSAFFEADGRHVATTIETPIDKVPTAVRKAISSHAKGKELIGLVQYTSDTESVFFVEYKQGKKKSIFKISPTGSVSRFN
jgi:hypothetical protein